MCARVARVPNRTSTTRPDVTTTRTSGTRVVVGICGRRGDHGGHQAAQDGAGLAPRHLRIGRQGDVQRGLVERADQHVGERIDRLVGDRAGVDQLGRAAPVTRPSPWRMPTSRHRSQPSTAGPSSRAMRRTSGSTLASSHASAPATSKVSGSSVAGVVDGVDQPGGEIDLDRLEHGGEQLGLVGELVVERAAGDAGGLGDRVRCRPRRSRARRTAGGAAAMSAARVAAVRSAWRRGGHSHLDIRAVSM